MGSINTYEQYRRYFGFDLTAGTPGTGIVYAIYTIGNIVGSFAAGPATDWKGIRNSVGFAWITFAHFSQVVNGECSLVL